MTKATPKNTATKSTPKHTSVSLKNACYRLLNYLGSGKPRIEHDDWKTVQGWMVIRDGYRNAIIDHPLGLNFSFDSGYSVNDFTGKAFIDFLDSRKSSEIRRKTLAALKRAAKSSL